MSDSSLTPSGGLTKEKESYTFSPTSYSSKTKNSQLHSSVTNAGYNKKYESSSGKKYISTSTPRRKANNVLRTYNDATEWTSTGTGEVMLTAGRSEQNPRGRSIKSSKFIPSPEINGLDELTDQVYEDKITGNEVYTETGPATVTAQVYNSFKNRLQIRELKG